MAKICFVLLFGLHHQLLQIETTHEHLETLIFVTAQCNLLLIALVYDCANLGPEFLL